MKRAIWCAFAGLAIGDYLSATTLGTVVGGIAGLLIGAIASEFLRDMGF